MITRLWLRKSSTKVLQRAKECRRRLKEKNQNLNQSLKIIQPVIFADQELLRFIFEATTNQLDQKMSEDKELEMAIQMSKKQVVIDAKKRQEDGFKVSSQGNNTRADSDPFNGFNNVFSTTQAKQ